MESLLFLLALIVSHIGAYNLGKNVQEDKAPSDAAWIEVKNHETDMRFAHMRWLTERKDHHEA